MENAYAMRALCGHTRYLLRNTTKSRKGNIAKLKSMLLRRSSSSAAGSSVDGTAIVEAGVGLVAVLMLVACELVHIRVPLVPRVPL
eukprot:10372871-Alexandrium_andersonii.AAC.1